MQNSQFIAQLLGPIYLAIGVGGFVNRANYIELVKSFKATLVIQLLSGVLSLLVGLLIVLFHNHWVAGWPVLITMFGWIGLLKGVSLLVLPVSTGVGLVSSFAQHAGLINVMMAFCVLIGAVFTYFGYFA
ncbi:hypothetical protein [Maritalea porphyrae]|uniref:hypothetical protein n=1 Tax=Maritalea porphyrae TaxID=880732 RepID=UPI0022B0234C|nr:hypothetical protein [Maritalea porphyrae]MCZ4273626.1 hypothetical protein [Maritalea porphyrae]